MYFDSTLSFRAVVDPCRVNDRAHADPNPEPVITQIEYRIGGDKWRVLDPEDPRWGALRTLIETLDGDALEAEWGEFLAAEASEEREYEPILESEVV